MSTYLTPADVAAQLGKTPAWVKREANAGRIAHIRLGRDMRFTPEHVEAYTAAQTIRPAKSAANAHGRVTRGSAR